MSGSGSWAKLKKFSTKHKWILIVVGILTLPLFIGVFPLLLGIIGLLGSFETYNKPMEQLINPSSTNINIPGALINKSVKFFGGHRLIPEPAEGCLAIVHNVLAFYSSQDQGFEIPLEEIKKIEIVDDSYTPSLGRAALEGFLGGDTSSQSYRPHKCVLKVVYDAGKREKDLCFNFNAATWAGAVSECQTFYARLNSLLD